MNALALIVLSPMIIMDMALPFIADTEGVQARLPAGVLAVLRILLQIVLSFVAQAVMIAAAVQHMRGEAVRFGEALGTGLQRFGSVIVASILVAIIVRLGALLLAIPGIIAWCMLCVAVPVVVMEEKGPFKALQRSSELIQGSKWQLFCASVLMAVIGIIAMLALSFVFISVVPGEAIVKFVTTWVASLVGTFIAPMVAVAYVHLREVREGVRLDDLASVFR